LVEEIWQAAICKKIR